MNIFMKNHFIEELNNKVNQYVYNNDLFAGGCCYSAYVIAKYLKKMDIKYKTVIFQYYDILNENDFNNAINGRGVAHVGIEVVHNFKKFIIGDCSGVVDYFNNSGDEYRIVKYDRISPEEILEGYKCKKWNPKYNKCCNGPLTRDIDKIYQKYAI